MVTRRKWKDSNPNGAKPQHNKCICTKIKRKMLRIVSSWAQIFTLAVVKRISQAALPQQHIPATGEQTKQTWNRGIFWVSLYGKWKQKRVQLHAENLASVTCFNARVPFNDQRIVLCSTERSRQGEEQKKKKKNQNQKVTRLLPLCQVLVYWNPIQWNCCHARVPLDKTNHNNMKGGTCGRLLVEGVGLGWPPLNCWSVENISTICMTAPNKGICQPSIELFSFI